MIERLSRNNWLSLYRLHRPSFILLVLPYLAFNYKEILASPFYSLPAVCLLLVSIIALDAIMKSLLLPGIKFSKTYVVLFVSITILLFYGFYLIADLQQLTMNE